MRLPGRLVMLPTGSVVNEDPPDVPLIGAP